ncbi:hypothetical protein [Nostoc phage N1]|nr:hypothetical protein [Nostoc phage N1]
MEEIKDENQQIKIQIDTKGYLKIEGKISDQSKDIIAQAMQQAEYYRLKTSQENKSLDEQTTIIVLCFIALSAFMIWSITTKVLNSFQSNHPQTENINYVR